MNTYKALRVSALDDTTTQATIDVVRTAEKLAAGDVVIEAHYSSINYKDALAITGTSRIMKYVPCTAGIDVAGVIIDSADSRFAHGDEVLVTGCGLGERYDGGLAQQVVVNADYVVHRPRQLCARTAMIIGTAGFTAGMAVMRMLDHGQTPSMGPVLVTGATGGVGSISIVLLTALGFEVHAMTRKYHAQSAYLTSLGAQTIIDATTHEYGDKPLEKAQYAGAIDSVGSELLGWITRVIQPNGTIASCGLAGGITFNTTVMPFILRGITLFGIDSVTVPMEVRLRVWELLNTQLSTHTLDTIATQEIGLDEVIDCAKELMTGNVVGRYVVNVTA